MVSDNAGTWKNKLAREATISKINPMNRNLPMKLKSLLVTVASVARLKKMIPVPPAARPIRCAPFFRCRATCRIGPRNTPATNVNPSRATTPQMLLRSAVTRNIMPIIAPNISSTDMIGLCAMNAKLIDVPTNAPRTVGIMVSASIM